MVIDGLGRHFHLCGDLLVGHTLETAHLEDAARLLGQLRERLVVEPCKFCPEVKIRGVELVGEGFFQLQVDARMDVLAGDAVQRLVADNHEQKPFQRKFFHQFVPVFPDVQHGVLYDIFRHGEGDPA